MSAKFTATLQRVTPKMAAEWLSKNHHNRNIRQAVVADYARDMASGNWQVTGEAIKFNCDGTLLDGQHRLMAIIRSDTPVDMLVVRGVQSAAQDVMDSGRVRGAADMLKLNGYKNSNVLAALARLARQIERTSQPVSHRGGTGISLTKPEIKEWVAENPDGEDAAAVGQRYTDSIDAPPTAIAYAWLRLARIDSGAAAEFFDSLANHQTDGPGDPRAALLRLLQRIRRDNVRLPQMVAVSLIFRTWNAWREGREVHKLQTASRTGRFVPIPEPK